MSRVFSRPASTLESHVQIEPYSSRLAMDWDAFVRGSAGGTVCHQTGWMRVIERTWGYRQASIYARRGGSVVGVLPLFHVQTALFGSMLVSSPSAIYGGALAEDAEAYEGLLSTAKRMARELSVDYLELRDVSDETFVSSDRDLLRKDLYVTFARPIPADEAELMNSFPKKIRYVIRLGQKHGLESMLGREELLDDFYEIYAVNMRNLGTPVFPKLLFKQLLHEFPDTCDILLVRDRGRPAGATMNFYFGDTVLPHYGCAHRELHHSGVSTFMYWELMRNAARRGFRRFDFGRSKLASGSWAFKRGWRMTELQLPYRYYLVRARDLPSLNPTNPRFKLLIKTWQHLPLGLSKLIGPIVVRNIP